MRLGAALVVVTGLLAAGCGLGAADGRPEITVPPLPQAAPIAGPPTTPGAPGDVIAAIEAPPPKDGRAWVVDYHSQNLAGQDIAERAVLTVPMTAPPPGGFPLIAWGHASKGLADSCAPSLQGAASIPLVDDLIAQGYAVVAPDYEGLGAAGPHAYLVGESGGRSMLDAVRAAGRVNASGVAASSPVVLWGYSQGGHAATFAAQIAPRYAPELHLVGVAMAAPVSDVDHFVRRAENWPEQFGLLVAIVVAYHNVYPELDLAPVLTPAVLQDLDELELQCMTEVTGYYYRPIPEMLVRTPRDIPAFAQRFRESLAGSTPVGVPVLVTQGNADQIIDIADTDALVERLCGGGAPVSYLVRGGENHGILDDDVLLPWIRGRIVGDQAPNTCPGSPGASPSPRR